MVASQLLSTLVITSQSEGEHWEWGPLRDAMHAITQRNSVLHECAMFQMAEKCSLVFWRESGKVQSIVGKETKHV
jgi:hypothetical protein